MDEKLRYPFIGKYSVAYDDAVTFRAYMTGLITKRIAIDRISKNNGVPMSEEQFDYYLGSLGYGGKHDK